MAENSVLTNSTSAAAGEALVAAEGSAFTDYVAPDGIFTVQNLFATIECISLADSSYDQMISDLMSSQTFLEVPFKAYYAFQQSHTGTSRFQVSSQSIDRIWSTFRYNGANVVGADAGGRKYPYTAGGPPIPVLSYTPNPVCESRIATGLEKYVAPWCCFQSPAADLDLQWQLNGSFIPQSPMSQTELFPLSCSSLPPGDFPPDELTMAQYLKSNFVTCLRLNMKDSERSRILSGLDTRSSNLTGLLNTSNGTVTSFDSLIFVETSATLRIESGRAISIIA